MLHLPINHGMLLLLLFSLQCFKKAREGGEDGSKSVNLNSFTSRPRWRKRNDRSAFTASRLISALPSEKRSDRRWKGSQKVDKAFVSVRCLGKISLIEASLQNLSKPTVLKFEILSSWKLQFDSDLSSCCNLKFERENFQLKLARKGCWDFIKTNPTTTRKHPPGVDSARINVLLAA